MVGQHCRFCGRPSLTKAEQTSTQVSVHFSDKHLPDSHSASKEQDVGYIKSFPSAQFKDFALLHAGSQRSILSFVVIRPIEQ
jgi:hypothetical protein